MQDQDYLTTLVIERRLDVFGCDGGVRNKLRHTPNDCQFAGPPLTVSDVLGSSA